MVSRQETARPLLTPGEVMQLPPDEAVVMVSSVAPIKAKKLRYYADANFKRRVLPPPVLAAGATPTRRRRARRLERAGDSRRACRGIRRWPGAGRPTTAARAVSPNSPKPSPTTPSWPRPQRPRLLDDDDMPLPLPRQLDPAMQRTARLASLDPNDGIEL
jgi:type IV secretion system protein VirD4